MEEDKLQASKGTPVRVGRWTEERTSSNEQPKKAEDISFEVEDERLNQTNEIFIDNIPDIDELHEEEQATQIATPPSAAVLQIATYKQLDADLMKHTQLFTMNGEVNLKLLAKAISPESEVKEEEKAWEWDRLFTELSNDIKEIWRVGKEGVNVPTTSS